MKLTLQPFFKQTVACYTIAALFVGTIAFSQENAEEKLLLVKANELVFSNPDETIKIANHLSKKSVSDENRSVINVLFSKSYISKGDYKTSVSYIFQASENSKALSDSVLVEIAFVKAGLCRRLHLYKQMDDYLNDIQLILSKSDKTDYVLSAEAKADIEKVYAALDQKKGKEALNYLQAAVEKNKEIRTAQYVLKKEILLASAVANMCIDKFVISEKDYNEAYASYKKQNSSNTIFEIKILSGLAELYFQTKEYDKAINVLLIALPKTEKLGNESIQETINYQLADNYLALGNKEAHQKYFDSFIKFNTTVVDLENEAVNSFYTLETEEQDKEYEYAENLYHQLAYIGLAAIFLISLSGFVLFRLNKAKIRRLREIIGYLEVTDKLLVKPDTDKKELKKISIPTETEQAILAKLKKFESSTKYTHKDMSLATLAAQLDTNTKYLSETINKHYHDNFNTYINRLRINYIIEKLKNEPEYLNYKISYLAEESGFSSHSSFATVFKTITGIAPTVFIELIGKEITQKKA
jgi:AraC-like DNA-binding protein